MRTDAMQSRWVAVLWLACAAFGAGAQASLAPGSAVPQLQPRGMLTMRSLRMASISPEGSRIYMGPQSEYSIGTDPAANFLIQKATMSRPLVALDARGTLLLGARRVEAASLNVAGDVAIDGVRQWRLVHSEDFGADLAGWSRREATRCGGVTMLGGFCKFSRGEVTKTFGGLPPHKQLRVAATYHFIDRWIGESGYMKLGIGQGGAHAVVWSEQYSQPDGTNGINLCGQEGSPEGKFSVPIDVTVAHSQPLVQLAFGSTMDDSDPCDESWGISSVEVYVRS